MVLGWWRNMLRNPRQYCLCKQVAEMTVLRNSINFLEANE
jgi:hypothetical protein